TPYAVYFRSRGSRNVASERGVEQLAAPLLGEGNGIATGGWVDQRHFDDSVGLSAVDAKPLEVLRGPRLSAQGQHRIEGAGEPSADAEEARKAVDLRFDRLTVEHEHIRHEHAVGRAVMGIVERAKWMREGMDCAKALLKGCGAHRRGAHHMGARLEIAAVGHGLRQVD